MGRGFLGRRRDNNGAGAETAGWPELPGPSEAAPAQALDPPALSYVQAIAKAVPAPVPDPPDAATRATTARTLATHIAACRNTVADALYASSRDYQVLCDLVHENLPACEEAVAELRRRLDGNVHYAVLAKLDEACALAEAGADAAVAER
jgi:hypothetical protein